MSISLYNCITVTYLYNTKCNSQVIISDSIPITFVCLCLVYRHLERNVAISNRETLKLISFATREWKRQYYFQNMMSLSLYPNQISLATKQFALQQFTRITNVQFIFVKNITICCTQKPCHCHSFRLYIVSYLYFVYRRKAPTHLSSIFDTLKRWERACFRIETERHLWVTLWRNIFCCFQMNCKVKCTHCDWDCTLYT